MPKRDTPGSESSGDSGPFVEIARFEGFFQRRAFRILRDRLMVVVNQVEAKSRIRTFCYCVVPRFSHALSGEGEGVTYFGT